MKNLQAITDRVSERYKEMGNTFNINQLRSILRDLETPLEDFELPEPPAEGMPYSRKVLFRNEILEVVLLRWNPAAESSIHDHGSSYGIIRVLSGILNFQIYDNYLRELALGSVPAIDTFDLPEGIIHKMFNPSRYNEAVSLNFYCPNIDGMSLYDPVLREKLTVSHNNKAWNPQPKDILTREKLPDIPEEVQSDENTE